MENTHNEQPQPQQDNQATNQPLSSPEQMVQNTPATTQPENKPALWGFICALIGVMLPVPILDVVVSLTGLVLSIMGANSSYMRGLAIAGIILGVIGVIGGAVLFLSGDPIYSEIWNM